MIEGGDRIRGPKLRHYQHPVLLELLYALQNTPAETFTVMFPRQAGKNEIAATLVQALLRRYQRAGGSVVVTAPTLTPQGLISFERARESLARSAPGGGPGGGAAVDGAVLRLGRARAYHLSASPAAHVAGHTASIALIADEAQEIDREWFERQFRPMAASTGASTVLIGTPWDGSSLLDEAVARNRERDAHGPIGQARFHYEVSWQEVGEDREQYGRFVASERERLGAESIFFRTQYALKTVEGAGNMLGAETLAALEGSHPRLREPVHAQRYVGGLDLGGGGANADRSVLTIARLLAGGRSEVVEHVSWQSVGSGPLELEVLAAARLWSLERLTVDASGMGRPMAARLARELAGVEVDEFLFSLQSKSTLGYELIAAIGRGHLALYRDDGSRDSLTCRAELRACQQSRRPNGNMRWGDTRKHDDYVVSLALAVRAAADAGDLRLATGRRRIGP